MSTPFVADVDAVESTAPESAPLAAATESPVPLEPLTPEEVVEGAASAEEGSSGFLFRRTRQEMSLMAPDGMEEDVAAKADEEEEEEEEDIAAEEEETEAGDSLLRFLLTPIIETPLGAEDDAEDADPKVIFRTPTSSSSRGNGAVNAEEEEEEEEAPLDLAPKEEEEEEEEEEEAPEEEEGPALEEEEGPAGFLAGLR